MLDLATTLDADFKVLVFETFVKSKILEWRDIGGDNYILLNKAIDTLADRKNKNNHGVYIQVAKQFRQKFELIDTNGYNVKEAIAETQQRRANWEDKLVSMIELPDRKEKIIRVFLLELLSIHDKNIVKNKLLINQ